MSDTFAEIVSDLDAPPILYSAVLASIERLAGTRYTTASIGLAAWQQLTLNERRNSMATLLESYASRVCLEEAERQHQAIADRPDIASCLDRFDEVCAWDAVADGDGEETTIDRATLGRLLDEIDLLRRRSIRTDVTP